MSTICGYPGRLLSSLVYSKPWGSLDAKDSEWDRLDSTGDEANVSNVCRLF